MARHVHDDAVTDDVVVGRAAVVLRQVLAVEDDAASSRLDDLHLLDEHVVPTVEVDGVARRTVGTARRDRHASNGDAIAPHHVEDLGVRAGARRVAQERDVDSLSQVADVGGIVDLEPVCAEIEITRREDDVTTALRDERRRGVLDHELEGAGERLGCRVGVVGRRGAFPRHVERRIGWRRGSERRDIRRAGCRGGHVDRVRLGAAVGPGIPRPEDRARVRLVGRVDRQLVVLPAHDRGRCGHDAPIDGQVEASRDRVEVEVHLPRLDRPAHGRRQPGGIGRRQTDLEEAVGCGRQVLRLRSGRRRHVVADGRIEERVVVERMVLSDLPRQSDIRQRAVLRVVGVAHEREHVAHGKRRAVDRQIDDRNRRRVADVDLDRGLIAGALPVVDRQCRIEDPVSRIAV